MTLLVRDEIDIIKANIEYHLNSGVDNIIITDNGSIDGTYELCRIYLKKGVVEIIREPPQDFSQYAYVTKMANLASNKYEADWIFHCDADEFFISRKYQNIKLALEKIACEHPVVNVRRHDFAPIEDDLKMFSPAHFPYRKSKSLNLNGRPLPPKVVHRSSTNIKVAQGNHSVLGDDLSGPPVDADDIEVFHYPIRSYNQFKLKVRNGGSGYSKNTTLGKNVGFHKRYWYDLLLKNELKDEFDRLFFNKEKLSRALEDNLLVEDLFLASLRPFNLDK